LANTKTAKKQLLVTARNHKRNLNYKTRLKSAIKKARAALKAPDATAAAGAVNEAVKTLYRSATKGIIKKQNASRRVGRLMKAYGKAFAPAAPATPPQV
jgi:small subunit ribosomal protein S20